MSLTCAVPKGRPHTALTPFFKALGGDGPVDPSRKLTVYDRGLDMTFLLAKSMDVPTYVEYGAADIGIVGKDVLLEQRKNVVELLDLKISRCELVMAVPEHSNVQSVSDLHFNSRVATKYPRIAEDFFNNQGIQVELIPLSGSIELAPLAGLADVVVDLTETGTTLRENGLRIVGRVVESSLRLIANPISYKVSFERIRTLTDQLRTIVASEVKGA